MTTYSELFDANAKGSDLATELDLQAFITEQKNIKTLDNTLVFKGFLKATDTLEAVENNIYTASEDMVIFGITLLKGERLYRRKGSWYIYTNTLSLTALNNVSSKTFTLLTTDETKIAAIRHFNSAIIDIKFMFERQDGYEYSITVFSNNSSYRRIRIFKRTGTTNTEISNYTVSQSQPYTEKEFVIVKGYNNTTTNVLMLVDWSLCQNVDYYPFYPDLYTMNAFLFNNIAFNYSGNNYNLLKSDNNLITSISQLSTTGWTISDEVADSNLNGWNNYIFYNKNLNEDKYKMSVVVSDTTTGYFEIAVGKRAAISGTAVSLCYDETGSYLKFYILTNALAPTEILSFRQTLVTSLANNTKYCISLKKNVNALDVELFYETGEVITYTVPNTSAGFSWGFPSVWAIAGDTRLHRFDFAMPYKRNPKVLVYGDSFIEGNSIVNDKDKRYGALLSSAVGEDEVILLGKGGESTISIQDRFYPQTDWFNYAKYCIIALGTNDNNFSTYQTNIIKMINYLIAYNIIPILVTVTSRTDWDNSVFQAQVNAWVRASGYRYIDMSYAVSEPGTNERVWKTGLQLGDNIHPSIAGHAAMFNRIKFDIPELIC